MSMRSYASLLRLEQDYLPVCGNGATLLCYTLSMLLNIRYLEGTCYGALGLAPLMLLLSPGKHSVRELDDPKRYAPVVSSVFISCSIAAVWELGQLAWYRLTLCLAQRILRSVSI